MLIRVIMFGELNVFVKMIDTCVEEGLQCNLYTHSLRSGPQTLLGNQASDHPREFVPPFQKKTITI